MPWKKKTALAVLALFALIFLFLVEEHFRGKWAFARWQAQMAAKGEPIAIPQATVPLPSLRDNGMPPLLLAAGQIAVFPANSRPPSAAYVAQGKVIVITRLPQWSVKGRSSTNISWAIVEGAVKAREPAMNAAAEALAYPKFHSGVDYYNAWSTLLPHLGRLRHLEWSLDAAALLRLRGERIDDAVEFLVSAIRIPCSLADELFTISQVVRMSMAQDAFETTWQALHVPGLTDTQLARLQEAWTEQDFIMPMRRSINMEHVLTSHEFDRFRKSDESIEEWLNGRSAALRPAMARASMFNELAEAVRRTPEFLRKVVFAPIWKFAWSYQDELRYAQTIERAIGAWDQARGERSMISLQALGGGVEYRYLFDDDPALDGKVFADLRYVMSPRAKRFFPVLKRAFATQTLRELAITAIALKRYELREGKPAATIEQLVPDFLKELPRDFMDGNALKYRLTPAGPLLYSVGYDGKDDGGDSKAPKYINFTILNGADFVWPQEASPEEVKTRFDTVK